MPDNSMGLECGGCLPSSEPALICQHPVFLRGHSSVRDAGSHLKLHEFEGAGAWILIWAQTSDNWIFVPSYHHSCWSWDFGWVPSPCLSFTICTNKVIIFPWEICAVWVKKHWINPRNFVILKCLNFGMFWFLCDWQRVQGVFWLRFPCGKLDTLICVGVYWLEKHHVFKSITRWTVLLNSHKHVTVHNSSKETS